MAIFNYKALRADGTVTFGDTEAASRHEALGRLDGAGLKPISLTESSSSTNSRVNEPRPGKRVPPTVVEAFIRQLSSLLTAGLPLARSLRLLAKEADPAHAVRWSAVHDSVVDGNSLAQAMGESPDVFPEVYTAMVRAGETGGFLDIVLGQIADFQNRDRELKSRVYGALIYPAVLAFLSVAALVFLLIFFIPRFQDIFSDFGAVLPPLTQVIIDASVFLQNYGLLVILGIVTVIIFTRRRLRSEEGKLWFEQQLLRLPVIGAIAARYAMTRFCRMLGTLTAAGVPLINALKVARESLGNQVLASAVDSSIESVQHGEQLGASLATCPELFSGSIIAMITVAEQSGQLDNELLRIANQSESDLDRQLRAAVALAEPALLFIMAAFIGFIVIGMVLPIFNIQEYIN